jgi:hypothetical protein
MNLKINISILLLLSLVIWTGCEKESEPVTATLTLIEPTAGDTIPAGEALHMHGTVEGTGELHGYSLTLTNLTTNQVVYSGSNDNHQTSYAFDEHWVNTEGVTSSMRLTLVVNLDHDGTTSSKSVDFVAAQ